MKRRREEGEGGEEETSIYRRGKPSLERRTPKRDGVERVCGHAASLAALRNSSLQVLEKRLPNTWPSTPSANACPLNTCSPIS